MVISLGLWLGLFALGLSLGSFFNVVVYRLAKGGSPLKGRSFCPKCKKKISWFDNIPLLSFVLLNGNCRHCGKPISWQYPLVELATALLTVGLYFWLIYNLQLTIYNFVFYLVVSYCLLIIFVSDFRFMIIPDEVLIFLSVISLLFFGLYSPAVLPFRFLAGFSSGLFFYLLYELTKGKGMGFGDVKLAFLIGFLLGFPFLLWAFFLAFLTGACVGVILILSGRKRAKSKIAFGPFLSFNTWVVFLWQGVINSLFLSVLWP